MKVLHYPLQDGHPEIDDDVPGLGAHTECLASFATFLLLLMLPIVSRSENQQSAELL